MTVMIMTGHIFKQMPLQAIAMADLIVVDGKVVKNRFGPSEELEKK